MISVNFMCICFTKGFVKISAAFSIGAHIVEVHRLVHPFVVRTVVFHVDVFSFRLKDIRIDKLQGRPLVVAADSHGFVRRNI